METCKGNIHQIETFGSVDGPGVRFVIFVQGCNMRCKFCHNPDTWSLEGGQRISAEELVARALRYRPYWGKDGGITVSGGEPLLEIDFLIELFKEAKRYDISTVIDTAGGPFTRQEPFFSKFKKLMEFTDLLLVDIKHIDDKEHVKLTGVSNGNILDMFRYLSDTGKPIWVRHVLVPGITDNDEYLTRTRDFIRTLKNVRRVEVLPYHSFGKAKYDEMGIPYPLKDTPTPSVERVENAKKILETEKYEE
ncbi:pyruvate formate lyase-activating protein [Treponema parvum]|uniref:Pyruvate formate-lyase-activating enzyme n=1 Tax=Treponema parvum TaxID=138851 RepID=A0A975IF64_9SPIR|nr:pyruvate formate-lyase-activating protein [Treponema parvum]QTQ14608.1 pyruvate formate lyase-activating protein [Treponema parvum]